MSFVIYKRLVKIYKTFNNNKGVNSLEYTSVVVVGDKKGGVGFGKASNLNQNISIFKALNKAKSNFFRICLKNNTIPHPIIGKSSKCIIYLFPLKKYYTFTCGSYVRTILNIIGIRNISAKIHGSVNFYNILNSLINALKSLNSFFLF
ncbi:hypothetical protein CU086_00230 [Candidatus Nasuia deltocephalinicola]|uniref:Small ribosomal subunit protein uS5 n=1 Tax=Candidatus Nasuia deltocephalincola TaxID=1160784 RepID=A0A975A347_9PROT|nr:hypothetical protein CU086_00230 [Candidatus Nasuia deltocephalinicola]